jgi:hypothetical protein
MDLTLGRANVPLQGEWAGDSYALNFGSSHYSASWDLDFAPRAAMFKVTLGDYYEFGHESSANVGVMNIRYRTTSGVDKTITYPAVGIIDHKFVAWNSKMTHVTFGMQVREVGAGVVYTLGFWD